jgi:predicted KAP-like P-loop ATPase
MQFLADWLQKGIPSNRRDSDFADGDLEEMDKRSDRRRSKAVEDMSFILSPPILYNWSRY